MTDPSIRPRNRFPAGLAAIAAFLTAVAYGLVAAPASAEDGVLAEAVEFTGVIMFIESGVPALIIGAIQDGETAVAGFGEISDGSGQAPDGDTILRIGSITKAFTGTVLASLVADGTVALSDPLQKHLDWGITVPIREGREIRLIDLATHTSGLPRELERPPGPPDDPFSGLTAEAYAKALAEDPLIYTPGTGAIYSNFAYDALSAALVAAANKPYADLLKERAIDPAGLEDTIVALRDGDQARLLQGHNFDGSAMPEVPAPPIMAGASSLYSTTNDMLKWLDWHMRQPSPEDAETLLIDHAAYVYRDGLRPAYGFDESGRMDAMGLGWIVMMPEGDRPLLLQKAGGLMGTFVYTAFAPAQNIGVFVAINEFDFAAAMNMATVVNDLIATLAPR